MIHTRVKIKVIDPSPLSHNNYNSRKGGYGDLYNQSLTHCILNLYSLREIRTQDVTKPNPVW